MSMLSMFSKGAIVNSSILGKCELVDFVTKGNRSIAILKNLSGAYWVTWNDGYWTTGNMGVDSTLEAAQQTAKHYLDCGYGS